MEVRFTKSYLKDLQSMPKYIQDAAHQIAEILSQAQSIDTTGLDIIKMKGQKKGEKYYRIRTGTFRIIAEYISPTIILLTIGSRGDVYK
ncbi:type II toxin-antitoxin system RelE family toxin [Foetidibacter luteolus]|uniref:type II toxin-antitoxin system RelE family toxin n=1 Tax=Foetidibacter luteolus TaxID=2608880 RepID=UPI00129B97E6|nr:type II toxin-antitoxin system RelE/ParE family toxin [Foetidibacter luteolus]